MDVKDDSFLYICASLYMTLVNVKIEEAIVYLLATSQHGMKTEQIARELELRGLVQRRNGKPLDGKVIAAIVFKHPEVFCFNEGRVRLLM